MILPAAMPIRITPVCASTVERCSMKLPFKITAQTKGTQKAYRRIVNRYGLDDGRRIFLERAKLHGEGNTLREQVNSIYKHGGRFR